MFTVSDTTQKLLKNFSAISNSVLLLEGTSQRTVLQNKAVFALAEFPEAWPKEMAIYDLAKFLGALSEFKNPALDFKETSVTVSCPPFSVKYQYSDPTTIQAIPDKRFPTNNPEVEFTLSDYTLNKLKRTASLLNLESISVIVKNGRVGLAAIDPKNSLSHAFTVEIPPGDAKVAEGFVRTIPFKMDHLGLLLDGSYTVALSSWRYAYLTNQNLPIAYYITEQTKD